MFRRPIMLLLSVAIPAAMLAAAPEDPSPAGGHTLPPDMTALRRICPVRFPEPEARPGNSLPARHGSLPASAICSMRRLS